MSYLGNYPSGYSGAYGEFFNTGESIDEFNPRTLYVGNLDATISEEFLLSLFSHIGGVSKCKIIHEWIKYFFLIALSLGYYRRLEKHSKRLSDSPSLFCDILLILREACEKKTASDPYAFVEFVDHASAVQALTAMNKRLLLGKSLNSSSSSSGVAVSSDASPVMNNYYSAAYEGLPIFLLPNTKAVLSPLKLQEMRVNWATSPGTQAKVDTSKHFHVFVGDLSPEIDNKMLREAFAPYGEISDVKVIRDLQTLKSKGYGFVSYVSHDDAERAIEQMNGQWLGRRTIRTNWATRKPGLPGQLTFDDVMAQSSPQNTTVYVGSVAANTTDDDLRRIFARFGSILEVRVFKQQGYAFVRFDNKESAAHAILNITGTEINGSSVRCSWGKEGGLAASNNTAPNYGYGYNFNSFSTPPVASHSTPANPNFWNQYYTSYMPPHGQPGPNPAPTVYPQQWQTNYWPPQGQQQ
ncbi:Nucleolysin TIAR [Trichinella pseudospiralis]|uniref:Nucleolysin TIAR n=1 Tax=Trichinella pseudospiralis TaxID=6337 RepID=A0A0V1ILT8_TRIPS|nr:Nucleolysin TIAR [Trichinella pseudospiralis]